MVMLKKGVYKYKISPKYSPLHPQKCAVSMATHTPAVSCEFRLGWRFLLVWTIRCSHSLQALFCRVKTMTPFPIFAVLLLSSTISNKKASNRNGGKWTWAKNKQTQKNRGDNFQERAKKHAEKTSVQVLFHLGNAVLKKRQMNGKMKILSPVVVHALTSRQHHLNEGKTGKKRGQNTWCKFHKYKYIKNSFKKDFFIHLNYTFFKEW